MHSFLRTRTVLLAVLCSLGLAAAAPAASAVEPAKPKPGAPATRGFRLFARSLGAMSINRVLCGLSSDGQICVDSLGSSTIGGGFWPKGTADQYVFNSGLQVAGIIGDDGGAWAGDTTGAFFFDPKGTTQHGQEVEPIYNSNDPDDFALLSDSTSTDPVALAARVPADELTGSIFDPLLRGRAAASQGDVWWLSWDGNPTLNAGRPHPLGVLVEQRGMGWNFPTGNEDVLYFAYTFYNVTASDPAVYDAAGVRPGMIDILKRQGADFQLRNEQAFGLDIPDGGYTISNLFAAFSADPDVAEAGNNYSSVNVPFALGYTYSKNFAPASGWSFDASIFGAPFFAGSGFFGVKYLKSPVVAGEEVGLTLFGNTINGGAFGDAGNTTQLYRYLSNNISVPAGDAACNTGNAQNTHICYVNNTAAADMRFFQSSGPLQLAPGESGTIVVAYLFAPPVRSGACTAANACADLKPGDPRRLIDPALLAVGANTIDTISGYRGFRGADENGAVVQDSIDFVPGSLLGKAKVAQAVFDVGFLLPFAPDAPPFFLIPGNNAVTVLWRPSASETTGDPFFAIASQPLDTAGAPNALFDPNYRQLDVEGYRIYRGRVDSPNSLSLIAQFDYAGTVMADFTGQVNPSQGCAPELGINVQTITPDEDDPTMADTTFACPVPFDVPTAGVAPTVSVDVPLVGELVQVKLGQRLALASGEAILVTSDTSQTGNGAGFPQLRDTEVPFTFIDHGVRSNLRYFYAVTAFDINSFQSGPSSIESPRNTKPVIPVVAATNFDNRVEVVSTDFIGRGTALNPGASNPTIDPATGMFSGPFPPANGWTVGVGALAAQVLTGEISVGARLDSIQLGSPYQGIPHTYWFTASSSGSEASISVPVLQPEETGVRTGSGAVATIPVNNQLAARYGGSSAYKLGASAGLSLPGPDYLALYGRGCVNAGTAAGRPGFGDGTKCPYNGSRWFAGPSPTNNETQADPIACNNQNGAPPAPMTCYNNAGALPGVTTIFQAQCYQSAGTLGTCAPVAGIQSGAKRAADMNIYWGAGGVVDSVIDVTHNVPVPFDTMAAGSWGILNQAATAAGPNKDGSTILTNADFACVEPFRTYAAGGLVCPAGTPAFQLSQTAVPGAVGFFGGGNYPPAVPIVAGANNGFALYIAGDMFTFELAGGALPASGTVWALRQYTGAIVGGNGAAGNLGPYVFSNPEGIRPLTAVGTELSTTLNVVHQTLQSTKTDLSRVHTVPDPYYVTSQFEQTTDTKIIKFVNLPRDAIVRIYSSSGVLVDVLEHHSEQFGGEEDWNVRNRNNQVVASGVYFYHVEAGDARRVGRFTVVNFAQ
jgi:hypothetical protein